MGENLDRKKELWRSWIFLPVSMVYLLFFSAFTSPLFPGFLNYDSAIFMMVGKGILAGKELYVDIFDHKGPVLFWLEAVGMAGGRIGVFLLQTLFLWCDLLLIDRIAGMFLDTDAIEKTEVLRKSAARKRWMIIGMALLLLSYPLANGNLSEEYSLPFIFLPVYLFLRDYVKNGKPVLRHSYLYGLCFGILAFIRLNNAVTIGGIVLYWMIVLVKDRDWKGLLLHIGTGLAGIATITLPVVGWFWAHGSLYDMIYASFLFNFRYSSHVSFLQNLTSLNTLAHMMILFSPLLLAMLVFGVRMKDRKLAAALELIMVVNILSLFMGHGYNHYFTVTVPLETLMCICMVSGGWENKSSAEKDAVKEKRASGAKHFWVLLTQIGMAAVLAGYGILAARIVVLNVKDYYMDGTVTDEYETVEACLSRIPEEDRAYVLGYNAPAKYYLIGDILPCFRYGILQENWSRSDAAIMEEVVRYLEEGDVRWVMTESQCDTPGVLAVLDRNYELVEENQFISLYRRK